MANQIRTIELRQINPTGKSLLIFRNHVKPVLQKYFALPLTQITSKSKPSCPTEGRAHVTIAGRDAVDAGSARDERGLLAYGEVVWFRRPNRWRQACEKKHCRANARWFEPARASPLPLWERV